MVSPRVRKLLSLERQSKGLLLISGGGIERDKIFPQWTQLCGANETPVPDKIHKPSLIKPLTVVGGCLQSETD